jgi:hypothetical protein
MKMRISDQQSRQSLHFEIGFCQLGKLVSYLRSLPGAIARMRALKKLGK